MSVRHTALPTFYHGKCGLQRDSLVMPVGNECARKLAIRKKDSRCFAASPLIDVE
jgi:hypothetical protein